MQTDIRLYWYIRSVVRYRKNIGHRLTQAVAAEFRAELGRQRPLTQAELSQRSGIPVDTLGKLLRGEGMFDVVQIDSIATGLHLEGHDVLARAEEALARAKPSGPSRQNRTG